MPSLTHTVGGSRHHSLNLGLYIYMNHSHLTTITQFFSQRLVEARKSHSGSSVTLPALNTLQIRGRAVYTAIDQRWLNLSERQSGLYIFMSCPMTRAGICICITKLCVCMQALFLKLIADMMEMLDAYDRKCYNEAVVVAYVEHHGAKRPLV